MIAGGALAEPLEDGVAAFERGDYETAAFLLRPLAEQGDARAAWHLGLMYRDGAGVSRNLQESIRWFRLAAEQGNVDAQSMLAAAYLGYPGLGEVPRDYAEAMRWLLLAAGQRDVHAQITIAELYGGGRGVPQDYILVHMWFDIASQSAAPWERPDIAAMRDVARMQRDRVAVRMTPEQIAEAQQLAREWDAAHPRAR